MNSPDPSPKSEPAESEARLRKLAADKANLELAIRMMTALSAASGLDNVIARVLESIMTIIGGTNILIYCRRENEFLTADVFGTTETVTTLADPEVMAVFTSGTPLIREAPYAETRMEKPTAEMLGYTWIYPLTTGSEVIAVLKIENVTVNRQDFAEPLRVFFSFATLILKNEIQNTERLVKSNLELNRSNSELARYRDHLEELVRRRTEALISNEMKFRTLFESASDALLLRDPEDGFLDCNPAALALFSVSTKEALLELPPKRLYPEQQPGGTLSAEGMKSHIDEALKEGVHTFEWRYHNLSGKNFPAIVLFTRIEMSGRIILHESIRDITGQKLEQEKRERLEEALRQTEKMEAIGQLAGGVAHDFNNMLGGILGAAELLKAFLPNAPKAQKYHSMILDSAQRAAALTGKLLAFSRKQPAASSPIDAHRVITDTVAILSSTIDRRVEIHVDLYAESSIIIGDPSLLQNALLNLGINASHAMPEGGRLCFHTSNVHLNLHEIHNDLFQLTAGPYLRIAVSDTGCGISEKNLARIFDPFFTTKAQGRGTGLGLSATLGTIRQHRGSITVVSREGEGTTFTIHLPLTEQAVLSSIDHTEPVKGTGTILVVDDEESVRVTAQAALEELGYTVLLAADGEEGVKCFTAHQKEIDLVLLDMIMPRMNGRDCFHALKKIRPDLPVILASGFSREEDKQELKANGLSGTISKPYRSSVLSRLIAETLKSSAR